MYINLVKHRTFGKNRNLRQKSKFWSKIKIWSNIELLVQNQELRCPVCRIDLVSVYYLFSFS